MVAHTVKLKTAKVIATRVIGPESLNNEPLQWPPFHNAWSVVGPMGDGIGEADTAVGGRQKRETISTT